MPKNKPAADNDRVEFSNAWPHKKRASAMQRSPYTLFKILFF